MSTFTSGPSVNEAVFAAAPLAETDTPMPSASDELKASTRSMPGWWPSRPSFTGSLHIAPDETIMTRELRSHFPGWLVEGGQQWASEGIADEDDRVDLLARNGVEQLRRVVATRLEQADPPALGQDRDGGEVAGPVHERAGRQDGDAARAGLERAAHGLHAALDRIVAHRAVDQPCEEIVLAPHHAFGHAGGAAGIEHDEVVAAAAPWCAHPLDGGLGGVLVRRGPIGARTRAVVDPEPAAHVGHAIEDPLDAIGEGPVEHHGDGVGVLPQVAQLVVAVAVVGVDRDKPDLDRSEGGLQILGRVVEVDRHLVLLRGAEVEEELRDAVGAAIELVPGDVAFTLRHGDRVGLYVRHGLPDVCVIPVTQFRPLPIARRQPRPRPAEMREARR